MKTCCTFALVGLAAISASIALAQAPQQPRETKPAPPRATPPAAEQPQLPPGWTEADMQACIEAGTPGAEHAKLAESTGVWTGVTKMWMAPGGEPVNSTCTSTITALFDGRYTKCELSGDMPGMGPFNGLGLYGFDNTTNKYQSTWIDNHSTVIMSGTGEATSDGKTMTWKYSYTCPVSKKPTTMREVERVTGKDTKTLEIFGVDPKSGKEFKMMEIAFTRKPGTGPVRATAGAGTN